MYTHIGEFRYEIRRLSDELRNIVPSVDVDGR